MEIGELRDVGVKTAAAFRELGIESARDLLDTFPFRYEDLRFPTPSTLLGNAGGAQENAVGSVSWLHEKRVRGLEIVEARIADAAGIFIAKWIGQRRFVYGRLRVGMRLFVRGRVERAGLGEPMMSVGQWRILNPEETYRGELVPIYRASKNLTTRKIRQVIARNLERLLETAGADPIPASLLRELGYPDQIAAYRAIHAPTDPAAATHARERFAFGEFLVLASAAALRRSQREASTDAPTLAIPAMLMQRFEATLPFTPTSAQRRVIGELWTDMTRAIPMNRLVQGDVGSGKTLVAAAGIVLAAHHGRQTALMAPTEVLAAQHASKLAPLLLPLGITVEAVFGSQSARSRAGALERIASGEAVLAVGTHALLTQGVDFARLGLVVIDEQHRFGVEQRARLRAKGDAPHTMHMTATPIPRTLAQTTYADLDISTIDELPPGRTPIETFLVRMSRFARVEEFVLRSVRVGGQAYIVAPAVQESEHGLSSAVATAERLASEAFASLRVGLLHGRLRPREKDEVMRQFASGELDVLVATTVIEVGVDVANASVMVVLDAHRFGLAQLHQLRGRVGRGAAKSYCLLVSPDDAEGSARLQVLLQTTDGFAIADADLELRGAGEFAGTAQSGAATLRFGDLRTDIVLYRSAKGLAQRILKRDSLLQASEHRGLRAALEAQPSLGGLLTSS